MPENLVSGEDDGNVVTRLTWEEQMDANRDVEKVSKSAKCSKGEKLCLTKVMESTEWSAIDTLFGPSFPGKTLEHLTQFKTLQQARSTTSKSNQQGLLAL